MADSAEGPFIDLPTALQDREKYKFFIDEDGYVTVRTSGRGTFQPSGLRTAGRHSQVTLSDSAWTPLPLVPLTGRNAISIQNFSGVEIKVNYRDDVGYIGITLPTQNERYYDIKDSIIIYARAFPGSGSSVLIDIEELS